MLHTTPTHSLWTDAGGLGTLDLVVSASGTPFPCNRATLRSGSGYFASQLESPAPTSVSLPMVPPEIFSKLLGCLYTGRLDCSVDTVYQLIWYAQMLQMPAAILQCSQFLSNKLDCLEDKREEEIERKPKIVKPIPSRGVPLIPTPLGPSILRPHLASFYSDWFLRYSTLTRGTGGAQGPCLQDGTGQDIRENSGRHNIDLIILLKPLLGMPEESGEQGGSTNIELVVNPLLDTAACDGPVKFHRIVNKFFSVDFTVTDNNMPTSSKGQAFEIEGMDADNDDPSGGKVDVEYSDESSDTGETYSCVYCNHVFKSHYCYQKHKRRHINPVTVDLPVTGAEDKKLLVIKDLNVQYFPCKICGAKFPSYYFVHKHKKMWHKDQMELEQEIEKNGQSSSLVSSIN